MTDNIEVFSPRDSERDAVIAQWMQNFGGGVGITIAIAAVLIWIADWVLAVSVSATVGAVVFGISMGVRAYFDEAKILSDRAVMLADIQDLEKENSLLRQRLKIAEDELKLATMDKISRSAGPNYRPAVELAPKVRTTTRYWGKIHENAEKLLIRAYAGEKWGKDTMAKYCGMTGTEWGRARDLLIACGAVNKGIGQTHLIYSSLAEAISALNNVQESVD